MRLPCGYYIFKWPKLDQWIIAFAFGPSAKWTKINVIVRKNGISICNNMGGQLGPRELSIGFDWTRMKGYWFT